jgi:hypothetical protein
MAVAVVRSDSMVLRAEDSGVATSSGAEQQPPAGRPISTIRQHYYPEGGWGWVVVACSVLVQILCHGLHGAAGVWLQVVLEQFEGGLLPTGRCELSVAIVRGVVTTELCLQSAVVTICTTTFNIQQFYVLPTQCIYVFCVDLRTNSDYFTVQH